MGQSFPVPQGDLVIGRQPEEGGARIDDPFVSRRHALLRQMPREARLYDLRSINGTKIDDKELTGVLLKNGDTLKFGDVEVQFVQEESN
jgi:pSer/pThr/pTyr-binding forkhead associated (FHA) protein